MKKSLIAFTALCFFCVILTLPQSCYYDNREELDGTDNLCDTADVSYANDIVPLLDAECYLCHSVASNSSGFPFDTYNGLKTYADNGKLVVRTNDANSPMPQAGLMSQCNRDLIKAWVNQGAKNN